MSHCAVTLVVVLVVLTTLCSGRSLSSGEVQWLLQTSPYKSLPQEYNVRRRDSGLEYHSVTKRAVFDSQCKGFYDRGVWARLNRVCVDCQNLYRSPEIENECRMGCFATKYFTSCVSNLLLPVDEYQDMAALVRGS
ncbi:crustacean hyperglycemic hormone [Cherax quadricarinatus]|uniref:Crustacean hyperglycemic hormone-like protein n=2 Tax=Cherax quadricarinatus TaxID=27406 RepID=A0A2U8JAD9_CHEQU|nr:crustacean hyperglycemic hormone-like [Cherax quadricarinatus]AWK57516.1 crustacean hyperglycemic hormone-like protein [Cherax quadricarinatus]